MQASLPQTDKWALRQCTAEAMAELCLAQLQVSLLPFRTWRSGLGLSGPSAAADARPFASHVERGAWRLPFTPSCLVRAAALSRMLRRRSIGHALVIAIRPQGQREGEDALHAWVEVAGERVLGDLPGEWHESARLEG